MSRTNITINSTNTENFVMTANNDQVEAASEVKEASNNEAALTQERTSDLEDGFAWAEAPNTEAAPAREIALNRLANLKAAMDKEHLNEFEDHELYELAKSPPEGAIEMPPRYLACTSEGSPDSTYRDNPQFYDSNDPETMGQILASEYTDGWSCNWVIDLDTGDELGWEVSVKVG